MDPIADSRSKILILGSLPGDESLRLRQYYANPRNHFWPVISAVLGAPLPESYQERVAMLTENGIALWDVLHSARREGSLDSNIKDARLNDLPGFLALHRGIEYIIFNGGMAHKCFKRGFPEIKTACSAVRSTSPVPSRAGNSQQEKLAQWREAYSIALRHCSV